MKRLLIKDIQETVSLRLELSVLNVSPHLLTLKVGFPDWKSPKIIMWGEMGPQDYFMSLLSRVPSWFYIGTLPN